MGHDVTRRKGNHQIVRPLWSDGGAFCSNCDKFSFVSEEMALQRLEKMRAKPNIKTQPFSHLLHVYRCPFGHTWHIGHDNSME